jgi:hypothetical protein
MDSRQLSGTPDLNLINFENPFIQQAYELGTPPHYLNCPKSGPLSSSSYHPTVETLSDTASDTTTVSSGSLNPKAKLSGIQLSSDTDDLDIEIQHGPLAHSPNPKSTNSSDTCAMIFSTPSSVRQHGILETFHKLCTQAARKCYVRYLDCKSSQKRTLYESHSTSHPVRTQKHAGSHHRHQPYSDPRNSKEGQHIHCYHHDCGLECPGLHERRRRRELDRMTLRQLIRRISDLMSRDAWGRGSEARPHIDVESWNAADDIFNLHKWADVLFQSMESHSAKTYQSLGSEHARAVFNAARDLCVHLHSEEEKISIDALFNQFMETSLGISSHIFSALESQSIS